MAYGPALKIKKRLLGGGEKKRGKQVVNWGKRPGASEKKTEKKK